MENKNTGIMVLLVIISLLIGGLLGYFVSSNLLDSSNNNCPKCEDNNDNTVIKKEVKVETKLHYTDDKNNDLSIPEIVNGSSESDMLNNKILTHILKTSYQFQNLNEYDKVGCNSTYEYIIKNNILVIFTHIKAYGNFMIGGLITDDFGSYYIYDITSDKELTEDSIIYEKLGLKEQFNNFEKDANGCHSYGLHLENGNISLETVCP